MRLHRAVILVLRILIAREEMRLPERKKALAGLQWSRVQILRKHPELFYASNHAFCYALQIVLNHRYVLLYWTNQYCARRPWETSSDRPRAASLAGTLSMNCKALTAPVRKSESRK